jgi:hypothetical protein
MAVAGDPLGLAVRSAFADVRAQRTPQRGTVLAPRDLRRREGFGPGRIDQRSDVS